MAVIFTEYTLLVTSQYDVIFRFATNVLAKFGDTTWIFSGAGADVGRGTVKHFRAMETMKNKQIVTNNVCFCSSTMLTSKIITEIIENHSEISGCSKKLQWLCFNSILVNYEITYDTVMKNSGACWRWGSSAPPNVLICWKSGKHPWKSAWKWHPTLLDFKKCSPRFEENYMKTYFANHTKKGLHDLCGREFVGKSCTKKCSWKFGEIRTKILRHTKNFLAPKPMIKRHLRPRCSPFERTEGWMPPPCFQLPASLCILIYTHSLYSLL